MADSVQIKGSSDSYDNTLKKIIDLNHRLNTELERSKENLESTNDIYKNLSVQARNFASSLGTVVGVTTKSSNSVNDVIEKVNDRVSELNGKTSTAGLKAIQSTISNLAGILKGKSNFANILSNAIKTTVSQSSTLQRSLGTTSASMGATAAASGSASAGIAAVGTTAVATGAAVIGLVTAIAALLAMMYKLGEGGYKYQMTIQNSQKVLGSSYKTAYEWANKMNDELGIAQDRTMQLISSTAQIGRAAGMSTTSSANMGIGSNRLAVQISNSTGIDLESIQSQVNAALGGSNSLGAYGINMDDNAAKYWLLQKKGIDAFNGSVSESTMIYARYMLIQEQANLLQYNNAEKTQSLASMQLKLKNTMDSLSKYAQAIFIPVFQAVTEVLLALAEGTLWVVNGFRELIGLDKIDLEVNGPSQESIDAAGDLYSQYKKMGDELDKLKQQLYSFDEVITQNPYDSSIADLSLGDAGLLDVIDEDGGVKDGKKYGEDFKTAFKTVLDRMGPIGDILGDFFNVDDLPFEKMTELQQWLNQPARKFIELAKAGDADAWDLITAIGLQGLHEMPIVSEIEALLNGDGADFVKSALQTGLLFNPVTWPIGLLWKGFDILSAFKDENGSWDVLIEFLHLTDLRDAFEDACNWLYNKLSGFGTWLGDQVKSALNFLNPVTAAQKAVSYVKENNITLSDVGSYFKNSTLFNLTGGLLGSPQFKYANGGFIKAAHIAQLDPNEVAVPLNNPSAQPAFKTMADRVTENMTGLTAGGNITVNVHLGENGAIIADNYSLQKFSKKIGENVANQLKSTGQLSYGRRY